jgi:hypothetical protein
MGDAPAAGAASWRDIQESLTSMSEREFMKVGVGVAWVGLSHLPPPPPPPSCPKPSVTHTSAPPLTTFATGTTLRCRRPNLFHTRLAARPHPPITPFHTLCRSPLFLCVPRARNECSLLVTCTSSRASCVDPSAPSFSSGSPCRTLSVPACRPPPSPSPLPLRSAPTCFPCFPLLCHTCVGVGARAGATLPHPHLLGHRVVTLCCGARSAYRVLAESPPPPTCSRISQAGGRGGRNTVPRLPQPAGCAGG